jgi:hypothetical protein
MSSVRRHRTLGPVPLWTLALTGPLAWLARLVVSYMVIAVACVEGVTGPQVLGLPMLTVVLLGIAAVLALVCLVAAVLSWRAWRMARQEAHMHVDEQVNWTSTMALIAAYLNTFFLLATLGETAAIFFLHPCT